MVPSTLSFMMTFLCR